MTDKFITGMLVLSIALFLYATTAITKYAIMGEDYSEFLSDAIAYDTFILQEAKKAMEENNYEKIEALRNMAITPEEIVDGWYFNILDWSQGSFITNKEKLGQLNAWKITNKLQRNQKGTMSV